MRIIRHNGYINSRKRRARWMAFLGFLVLTSTLWIALNPEMLLPAYIAMFAGFILFNIGMQQVGKWSRNPRNDQFLDALLRDKLSDRYALIHFAPIGKRKAEHLLWYPGGLLAITLREIDGTIVERGKRWSRKGMGLRRIFSFSGPQLGNPSMETDEAIKEVEAYLSERQLEFDVNGTIVFFHPEVELDIEEPEYPVLHGDELAEFIRDLDPDPSISQAEQNAFLEPLSEGEDVEIPQTQTRRRPVRRRTA
ncbi:MAG TPA: NERD domain-containing protein [Thermomicrobiales bacterium]|nr:NERD domain-containing protein [Thermomicrobiales bacterium]